MGGNRTGRDRTGQVRTGQNRIARTGETTKDIPAEIRNPRNVWCSANVLFVKPWAGQDRGHNTIQIKESQHK